MDTVYKQIEAEYGAGEHICALAEECEKQIKDVFEEIDRLRRGISILPQATGTRISGATYLIRSTRTPSGAKTRSCEASSYPERTRSR